MRVIGVNSERFKQHQASHYTNNGGYFYGKEIEENILPHFDYLDATVITVAASLYRPETVGRAVVVCHDNRDTLRSYILWLKKDMLFVCSKESTVKTLRDAGERAMYVPLSIDTEYVKQFVTDKTKEVAFVGNKWGFKKDYLESLPADIDQLSGMSREDLLREMAQYKRVIAEGRCLMEAQVLGAKTEVPQYKGGVESVFVEALDNRDTIEDWRKALESF